MKSWVISLSGRAARFAGFLAAQFRQTSSPPRRSGDAYGMAARLGIGAVPNALGRDDALAERVAWHLANTTKLWGTAAADAESCRALLSWLVLATLVARMQDKAHVLAEVADAFAIRRGSGVQQQEARAFLIRELQAFQSMVELATPPESGN